ETDYETAGAPDPCAGHLESELPCTSPTTAGDPDEELERQIDEALYSPPHDQFFSAPGGSSSQGGH
ncbi:hypothetical protein A2U01_0110221, partial [Trifolium medium]|nr:hypothetical protein [Trifolium medium]